MSDTQHIKPEVPDHVTSTTSSSSDSDSDYDTEEIPLPACPFGRVRSDQLALASIDETHKDDIMLSRLVPDAITAWDTRAILGALHIQNGIVSAKTNGGSKDALKPQTPKYGVRPASQGGGGNGRRNTIVRPATTGGTR